MQHKLEHQLTPVVRSQPLRLRHLLDGRVQQPAELVIVNRTVAKAQELYPKSRQSWERVEPVAESFGDLDPKMDAREADVEIRLASGDGAAAPQSSPTCCARSNADAP